MNEDTMLHATNRSTVQVRRAALTAILAALSGLAASVHAAPTTAAPQGHAERARGADTLPVKRITLYRAGVGYFEHSGRVVGEQTLSLAFDSERVNDILKSLVVLDQGGGVGSVNYANKEPLARRLASFGIDISDNPATGALLGRLRGEKVRLTTPDGPAEGTVLSVEERKIPVGGQGVTPTLMSETFVNLVTSAGVKSIGLSRVSAFEILNEKLAGELGLALAALAEQRSDKAASVDISFTGAGERPVRVGYVHETPVWKTTYRLVLPDETGSDPTLQGWAIVENTTDQDWTDVRLSLASGQPVAFTMDLHQPLFLPRPQAPVPAAAFARGRVYEADTLASLARGEAEANRDDRKRAMAKEELSYVTGRMAAAPAADSARAGGAADGTNFDNYDGFETYTADGAIRYGPRAAARGTEMGEQFRYEIEAPVTIERQRSAMLPILAAPIKGERVSVFNPADDPEHPMRGIEVTNSSGLELAPGPIAVFDGGSYAGDAQLGFTTREQSRLLAYATDLDVNVKVIPKQTVETARLRIAKGLIERTDKQRRETSYEVSNRDASRGRTVLIEHPVMDGWTLIEPAKPRSETNRLRRFEVKVGQKAASTLSVIDERTEITSLEVSSYPIDTLLAIAKQGKASQRVVDAVRKAADMQAAVNEVQRQISESERQQQTIRSEQDRIRSNMNSINQSSDLWGRYMKKLAEQETRMEQLLAQRDDLSRRLEEARRALSDYVANLDVE